MSPSSDGSSEGDVRLSVVIPAFGEEGRIADTIDTVRGALAHMAGSIEVIVVDDGSPDRTAEMAERAGADQVIRFLANRGKGAAVRAGVLAASGATVVFTDADLAYPPTQLERLIADTEAGWDMVVGNRHHAETITNVPAGRLRQLSGWVFGLAGRFVLAGRFDDTQCGLKAFRGPAAKTLFGRARIDGFAFDVELFLIAERLGLKIRQVPVELAGAEGSTVHVGSDALRMVRDLWRLRQWARAGAYDDPATTAQGRGGPGLQ